MTSAIRISTTSLAVLASVVCFARPAAAVTPRAERVTARIVERTYARQAIAEARAARAEARVAEIAPLAPVPPPPRPATVRRMARAGVPLAGPTAPAVAASPAGPAAASAAAAAPPRAPAPTVTRAVPAGDEPTGLILASPDVALPNDGTRSVLTNAEEPSPAKREPTPAPQAGDPAELLPTPPAR